MPVLLRRRGLGKASCEGIIDQMQYDASVHCNQLQDVDHFVQCLEDSSDKVVIRWGCTANIPDRKEFGVTIINKAKGIHKVADKLGFREILNEAQLCPATFFEMEELPEGERPMIVRGNGHAQGRMLDYCTTYDQVNTAAMKYAQGFYISEYIPKVAEYRAFCFEGRIIALTEKHPADKSAIAWNEAQGGSVENVKWGSWPLNVCSIALEAFALSELDFGGVDIIVDENGKAYVLEINSAPSCSPYRQKCFAKAIDYMLEKGEARHYEFPTGNNWKGYIHPAMTANM